MTVLQQNNSTDIQFLWPSDVWCETSCVAWWEFAGFFESLIWLKQSTSGSVKPLTMFLFLVRICNGFGLVFAFLAFLETSNCNMQLDQCFSFDFLARSDIVVVIALPVVEKGWSLRKINRITTATSERSFSQLSQLIWTPGAQSSSPSVPSSLIWIGKQFNDSVSV